MLERRASALASALPPDRRVFHAVRRGRPAIGQAVRRVVAEGFEELVVLPMHPHFCPAATGLLMRDVYRAVLRYGPHLRVVARTTCSDDAAYLDALARWIARRSRATGLEPDTAVLRFEAPPCGAVGEGAEGYRRAVLESAQRVAERVGWPGERVTVTCSDPGASGAEAWTARRRSADPSAPALVCALPFPEPPEGAAERTSDEVALAFPDPSFVSALKSIVLRGPRPALAGDGPADTLLPHRTGVGVSAEEPASLVMIGVSLPGSLRCGRGPPITHSTPEAFARVKRSHRAVRAFLDRVRGDDVVCEALVWNTCQRMEIYAWLPERARAGRSRDGPERAHDQLRWLMRELFGEEQPGLQVNVLRGKEARHHLMRTACGLNSDLPGDRDVALQLETACRIAQRAGTAGTRATRLVEEAVALAREVRLRTSWGDFSTGYCAAALARVFEVEGIPPDELRHVVIGGSTTSRSILSALRQDYGVPACQMTVVYRDHHGRMKELRRAIGNGRRLRVHAYADPRVLRAIEDADVVFFGLDQPEPVVEAPALASLRDFTVQPLTVVDFNSSGSVGAGAVPPGIRVWDAAELDRVVAAHSAITTTREGFARALDEVERVIAVRVKERRAVSSSMSGSGADSRRAET